MEYRKSADEAIEHIKEKCYVEGIDGWGLILNGKRHSMSV